MPRAVRSLVAAAARAICPRSGSDLEHELSAARDELQQCAMHDPLTGLANRDLLRDRLTAAMASADSAATTVVGVASYDVDDFRKVNDTYGHDIGDLVLGRVAPHLVAQA